MKQAEIEQQSTYPKWRGYYVFILLFLIFMFDYVDRFAIISIFPFLKNDWGLTDTQCGLLVSALFWSMVVFVVPIGAVVDRWSRKNSVGLMAIVWSLATAAASITRNFTQLITTRCVVGLGEAAYAPAGLAFISAIFKPGIRARMAGIWYAAVPLGQALGIVIGGIIAVHLGWRSVLGLVAIPGLIIAILFFWVKDYKTVELLKSVSKEETAAKVKMSKMDVVRELFRSKSLILNNFAVASSAFTTVAFTTWMPTYFQRFEGMSIERSGMMASVIMLLAIVGAPLGGFLTDQWMKKQSNARMLLPAITSAIAAILLFTALQFHGGLQFSFLLAFGLTVIMFAAGGFSVTQDVVHPGLRSTSYSINVIFQHLLGSALGPLVVGALSDVYGLDKALTLVPIVTFLAAMLFFIGSFFYKKDVDNSEKIQIVFDNR
jgi:MFS family permease